MYNFIAILLIVVTLVINTFTDLRSRTSNLASWNFALIGLLLLSWTNNIGFNMYYSSLFIISLAFIAISTAFLPSMHNVPIIYARNNIPYLNRDDVLAAILLFSNPIVIFYPVLLSLVIIYIAIYLMHVRINKPKAPSWIGANGTRYYSYPTVSFMTAPMAVYLIMILVLIFR